MVKLVIKNGQIGGQMVKLVHWSAMQGDWSKMSNCWSKMDKLVVKMVKWVVKMVKII